MSIEQAGHPGVLSSAKYSASCTVVCVDYGPESNESPISNLKARVRIAFCQFRVLRREQEFLSFSLVLQDKNENFFFFSITGFDTRTRNEIKTILARILGNVISFLSLD